MCVRKDYCPIVMDIHTSGSDIIRFWWREEENEGGLGSGGCVLRSGSHCSSVLLSGINAVCKGMFLFDIYGPQFKHFHRLKFTTNMLLLTFFKRTILHVDIYEMALCEP